MAGGMACLILTCAFVHGQREPIDPAERAQTARLRDRPVAEWLADLKKDNAKIRQKAAEALGDLGAKAKGAVPALAGALKDPERGVRAAAARALERIGPAASPALPALAAATEDKEFAVRRAAANALGEIGPDGWPSLVELLGNAELSLQAETLLARAMPGAAAVSSLLCTRLKHSEESVRLAGSRLLERAGKGAVKSLITVVEAKDDAARRRALTILGRIGLPAEEASPAIYALLKEKDRPNTSRTLSLIVGRSSRQFPEKSAENSGFWRRRRVAKGGPRISKILSRIAWMTAGRLR